VLITALETCLGDVYSVVGYPMLAALCHPAYATLSWLPEDSPLSDEAWSLFLDKACAAEQLQKDTDPFTRVELEGNFFFVFEMLSVC